MRNLSLCSCLVESYGYNFIHLRFSALCCGCHRAFRGRQIKYTCSSIRSLGAVTEVLVVFLVGQSVERHLVINQLKSFHILIKLYKLLFSVATLLWMFSFATKTSLFVLSVRLGREGAWMY